MKEIEKDIKTILGHQLEHTERLTRVESDLKYHIKRTDLLETMVGPIHKMWITGKGIIALVTALATLAAGIYAIKSANAETPQQRLRTVYKSLEKESGCKLQITSGTRTVAENKRVGGAKRSYHLYAMAFDIKPVDKSCISLKSLQRLACKSVSTILYSNHIHIDTRKKPVHLRGWYKWERKKHGTKSIIYSNNYYRVIGCK